MLWLFHRLQSLYKEQVDHHDILDAQQNRSIRADCQDPIFAGVVTRITRYALALTAQQLRYACEDKRKQKDLGYQRTRCTGVYNRSLGLPWWHKIATW